MVEPGPVALRGARIHATAIAGAGFSEVSSQTHALPRSLPETISGWKFLSKRSPLSLFAPNSSGWPCSSSITRSSRTPFSVKRLKAPSLKMLQF